jgi:hypothetical protein
MAIEYIGDIMPKTPQHIEDKLTALAKKATQGKAGIFPPYTGEMQTQDQQTIATFWMRQAEGMALTITGVLPCSVAESDANCALHTSLHNAAPALLAVVRAARALDAYAGTSEERKRKTALRDALASLDAVEV